MGQPPFVAVPETALERRRADKLTHGAWDLYELYCKHRNRATGQCNPSLKLLAVELKRSYTHASDCKTELVEKGWIRRLGRRDVEILVGEFAPPTVVQLGQKGTAKFGKFRTSSSENSELGAAKFGKFRTSSSENSELGDASLYEPEVLEPEVVAAAATAAGSPPATDPLQEAVDESFLTDVLESGVYPAHQVQFILGKLKLHCLASRTKPVRRQFLHWLSTERETPQQSLPGIGAPVIEMPARTEAALEVTRCEATCPRCFGSGIEVVPGNGARRCPERAPAPPVTDHSGEMDAPRREVN